MGLTDELAVPPLGADALAEGLALTAEVSWNQTAEDWAFFLAQAMVFGVRDGGRLVATAAVLPYPAGFAWVSLVIVTQSHRGRGLGTRLLDRCIATLRSHALVGMLDATPAGEKVYAPLGFKPVLRLQRWEGTGPGHSVPTAPVRSLAAADVRQIAAVDANAFGSERYTLLADLFERAGARGFTPTAESGYALVRPGRVASHLGPVAAADERGAIALIDTAIASTPGRIFLDVPIDWTTVSGWLAAHGFRVQRPFLRMGLGRELPYGDPKRLFATAGPEYG